MSKAKNFKFSVLIDLVKPYLTSDKIPQKGRRQRLSRIFFKF